MSRPFALLGFSLFAALALSAWTGPDAAKILALVCLGLALCGFFAQLAWGRARVPSVCESVDGPRPRSSFLFRQRLLQGAALGFTAAFLGFALFTAAWQLRSAPYRNLKDVEARVQGTVVDYPQELYQRCYVVLQVDKAAPVAEASAQVKELLRDLPGPFTLRLSSVLPLALSPGDTLECTVTFTEFSQTGLYSTLSRRLASGVQAGAYLSDFSSLSSAPAAQTDLSQLLAQVRRRAARVFSQHLPRQEASLLQTILLGTENDLTEASTADFQRTGTTHLLVISGLHFTTLAAFLGLLFGVFPLGRVGKNLLILLTLLAFLAVTGFPVSGQRAAWMQVLFYLSGCFGRRSDGVNSLGFAVFCICLPDPFAGGDLGFALSVMATLGLQVLYAPLSRGLGYLGPSKGLGRSLWRPVAESLAITLAATAFTLPIQIPVFGTLPLVAPLANLVLIFPCSLLLYAGFLSVLCLPVTGLSLPFLFCGGWVARFVLWAVGELARLPYGSLSLGQDTGLLTVGVLLLLVFLGSLPRRTKARGLLTGLAMAVALGASVGLHQLRWAGVTTLGVAEAGDSSCVVVIRDGSAGVLSLGGYNDSSGLYLLQAHNVSQVETLFLPAQDGEARLCAQRILENLPVERVLLPQGAYAGKDLEDQGVPVERASPGESFQLLPGLEAVYSQDGARLSFTAGGVDVIVELAPSGPGECQVLVTQQTDTQINSSFTVLQADGIMGETGGEEAELRSGRYVQPPEQSSLCLDFSGDGQIQIRREN